VARHQTVRPIRLVALDPVGVHQHTADRQSRFPFRRDADRDQGPDAIREPGGVMQRSHPAE